DEHAGDRVLVDELKALVADEYARERILRVRDDPGRALIWVVAPVGVGRPGRLWQTPVEIVIWRPRGCPKDRLRSRAEQSAGPLPGAKVTPVQWTFLSALPGSDKLSQRSYS